MSRVISLLFAGAGTAALAMLGVYLSENKYEVIEEEIPRLLKNFENSNGGKCVKEIFPDTEDMKGENFTDIGEQDKISSEFFEKGDIKGCLAIQWNKAKYTNENNKWNGNFRLIWSVREGNRGFVVFAHTEGKEKKNKSKVLDWSGAAYELSRENENQPWGKSRKLTVESKEQDKNDVVSKFPKVGSFINIGQQYSFWGFIDVPNKDSNEIENICGSGECQSDNKELIEFNGYWNMEGSKEKSDKQLGDWSSNLAAWWKDIFGDNKWNMQEVIKGKKVKWEQVAAELSKDKQETEIYTGKDE